MKDESARDKAIENLVSEKLRARSTAGNGCPDAEIIAAYFERTLAPKERTRWEAHFDTCAQCQHRIAALVRMDEAGEASISKPVAKRAPEPRKSSVLSVGGRTFGGWAWAAPVLLVVLVAGLWYTGEFDKVMNRHVETAAQAPLPSGPQQLQPKPATAENPNKTAIVENRVDGLQGGNAQASQASSAMTAKDELKAPQNVATTSGEAGQVAKAQALSPPPPPPKTDLSSERRNKAIETASAAPAGKGAPGEVQSLPLSGRNADVLSADEQTRTAATGQGAGSATAVGAVSGGRTRAAEKNEPVPATAKGAAGEVHAKAENAPAPAPPPPAVTTAKTKSRQSLGAFRSTTESSAGLFKKAAPLQPLAGTVKGTVRDASGAAIPGATVIVIDTSTQVAKVFISDDAGEYRTPGLNPGKYTIQAGARGFKSSVMSDISLQARAAREVDFALQVGEVSQSVEVQAIAAVVQTAEPQWRAGPQGLIQRRSGQEEWQTIPSGVSVDLYSISFPSREVGWAVGQDGTVLRSANGGDSWGRVASPTREDLIRVRAMSAESAEVTTRSGKVFKTTDGAAAWTRVQTAQ